MILMVSFSMVLQKTTSKMILHPIEKLLTQVKDTAATIFESVPDLGGPGEEEEDSSDDENNEDGTYKLLDDAGLSVEALSTWKLSPLEFDQIMNRAAAVFIIGPANHGIRCEGFLQAFVDEVEKNYSSVPYHNWFHAVDVAHATWRLANLCNVIDFLEYHETLAVLVAALCHCLGHPGVNSRFLIETKHTLAMTYNDRSPLQQMSSAKLFEITKKPNCGIFSVLSRSPTVVRICQIWVQKAMEENFLQGDEEKLLGLPVSPLNDREKATMSYSQIGFIEYLVAPFLLTVTKAGGAWPVVHGDGSSVKWPPWPMSRCYRPRRIC
eukprot:Skav206114  [mRNA]  locus=scaffold172:3615:8144:+ [translate_table: standard]